MTIDHKKLPHVVECAKKLDAALQAATIMHENLGRLYASVDTAEAIGAGCSSPDNFQICRAGIQSALDLVETTMVQLREMFGETLAQIEEANDYITGKSAKTSPPARVLS